MPVRVTGVSEAQKALRELAQIISSGKTAEDVFRRIGPPAIKLANSQTPVRTGHLLSRNAFRMISKRSAEFSNDADYAGFVHDGTSRMAPRPFLRGALEYVRQQFPALYIQDARKEISGTFARNRPPMA